MTWWGIEVAWWDIKVALWGIEVALWGIKVALWGIEVEWSCSGEQRRSWIQTCTCTLQLLRRTSSNNAQLPSCVDLRLLSHDLTLQSHDLRLQSHSSTHVTCTIHGGTGSQQACSRQTHEHAAHIPSMPYAHTYLAYDTLSRAYDCTHGKPKALQCYSLL